MSGYVSPNKKQKNTHWWRRPT